MNSANNQRQKLLEALQLFCGEQGSRTFSLAQLTRSACLDYADLGIGSRTPEASVRRLLQELRDRRQLRFNDRRGHYTLLDTPVLAGELSSGISLDLPNLSPDKREYLVESYARHRGWVQLAKQRLGCYCLMPLCRNSFRTRAGEPYIEVHHIVPLYAGGEDGIWNLAVLCAHHHRLAHFGSDTRRERVQKYLLAKVDKLTAGSA